MESSRRDWRLSIGLMLVAMCTLTAEVLLIRVFEVILLSNVGYAIITCAMFAFGVAGTYATIWPVRAGSDVRMRLAILALLMAAAILVLRPLLNLTPAIYEELSWSRIAAYLLTGGAIYLLVLAPFFLSGLLLAYLFSAYPARIRSLYFWDLAGAAVGCVIFLPFLRGIGPGGVLFGVAAGALVASALFAGRTRWTIPAVAVAVLLCIMPFARTSGYFEFDMHQDKRGVRDAARAGRIELTEWDPLARIDVIAETPRWKHIAYDGGSQSSHFYAFDGDFTRLRQRLEDGSERLADHFWHAGVLVSHHLKRDSDAEVLIFGSAGGQETKAALMFNPRRVDGIELVETVVRLGREEYADFIGRIFHDPRVTNRTGEGRSWLRTQAAKYDIIQIHSNHTTSFVTSGVGAGVPVYLHTVEAYEEYFGHLKDDGILHINHHFYPRLVTTAAAAWKRMGRGSFAPHVLVFERPARNDALPTVLIRMSPWSESEVRSARQFLDRFDTGANAHRLVVDPLGIDRSFLSAEFFSGELSPALRRTVSYIVRPSTDDRPYFNNIQKGTSRVEVSESRFTNEAMASAINERLGWPGGEYAVPGAIALIGVVFGILLIGMPLRFSAAGQIRWKGKWTSLGYFAALGAGFIVLELVLIQIFMKLLGSPSYTYATVIFAMLLSAGVGSLSAERLRIEPARRWTVPFIGALVAGVIFIVAHPFLFDLFLAAPLAARIAGAVVMIAPLGFFLGIPFPLGILWLRGCPDGAIAWAWGVNGLFTVMGGLAAGVLSMFAGFRLAFVAALVIYLFALFAFSRMRSVGLA